MVVGSFCKGMNMIEILLKFSQLIAWNLTNVPRGHSNMIQSIPPIVALCVSASFSSSAFPDVLIVYATGESMIG